jgi:uncharacterized protein (DUF433 family)
MKSAGRWVWTAYGSVNQASALPASKGLSASRRGCNGSEGVHIVLGSGDTISAFTEEQVERLTGLSKVQLRYWDRTSFFQPTYAAPDRREMFSRIYSFRDIVALRVLASLRNQYDVSLQHLREVSEKLNHLEKDLWVHTTLYVLKKRIYMRNPETDECSEVVIGQGAFPTIVIETIVKDTESKVIELRKRRNDQIGRVVRARGVNHNLPVISGTRIGTRAILEFRKAGYTDDMIIAEFPGLSPEDIQAAIEYEEKGRAA